MTQINDKCKYKYKLTRIKPNIEASLMKGMLEGNMEPQNKSLTEILGIYFIKWKSIIIQQFNIMWSSPHFEHFF